MSRTHPPLRPTTLLVLLAPLLLLLASTAIAAGDQLTSPTLIATAPGADRVAPLTGMRLIGTMELQERQTEVSASYTAEALRIVIRASGKNRHELTVENVGRDARVWDDDSVEVFLGAYDDPDTYWHLVVNPSGSLYDQYCAAGRRDAAKNLEDVRVSIVFGQDWWRVYIVIPYKSLGVEFPQEGDRWRFNIARTIPAPGGWENYEYSSLSPMPLTSFHNPRYFGFLEFGPWPLSLFIEDEESSAAPPDSPN